MTIDLAQAVKKNNEAVGQLEMGQLKDASVSLKQSITLLRDLVNASEQDEGRSSAAQMDTEAKEASPSVSFLQESNSVLDASFSSVNLDDYMDLTEDNFKVVTGVSSVQILPGSTPEEASHHYSIYDHAFSINEAENRQDLICAVIFYNLALVQHKRNVHRGRNLCRVLALYERAAAVTQNLPFAEDSIILLFLAISNNMIQIHSTLFDRSSLEQCLERLQLLIDSRSSEEDERFDFFVLSSICFGTDQNRCAPVA